MTTLILLAGILPGLLLPSASHTSPQVPVAEAARYRVHLLTMEQGDEVWERFGHNAIVIRDEETGQELAWNWGLFNFEDVDFIPRFLRGTMRYTMGPAELDPFVASYVQANRSVYANEIFLTQAEARELDEFVRWNYLPENRPYIYDYFRDNCSTRLRDALDGVLGGLIRDTFLPRETAFSYRWHTRRLVQETTWIDQGLSFLLGMRGDVPRTEWEAMFLPMELLERLEGVERPDEEGGVRPLLGPRQVVFQADREPPPAGPPAFSAIWLVLGLAGGGILVALQLAAEPRGVWAPAEGGDRWTAAAAAGGTAIWALFSGLLGLLLVLAWFTDHHFIQWNLNLFYASPLGLPLAVAAAVVAFGRADPPVSVRDRAERRGPVTAAGAAASLAIATAALSLGAAAVQLTPLVHQGNAEVVAVALPLHLAGAFVLARRAGIGIGRNHSVPRRMSSA